jgi:hypothetical protein
MWHPTAGAESSHDRNGRREVMIGMFAAAAVGLIAMGLALGIVVVVSIGIRREERTRRRLTVESQGPLASGARMVTSLWVYRARATSN